jgi:hypothetical protein
VELGPDATASELVQRVDEATDSVHDDVAVCVIRVDGEAAGASTVRVEELEVADGELDEPRVRRFLMACGIRPTQTEEVVKTARARAFADGSVLLRVRLARDRSGVDVLPARETGDVAAVARLAPRIAVEQ